MPSSIQFRDNFHWACPPWLTTGNAERYMYTLELMRDLLCERQFQAQTIRLPGKGDKSQIPFLAYDRQLVQGPLEPDAAFVERLKDAFPTWNEAGSGLAVLEQLQAYAQGYQSIDERQFVLASNPRQLQDTSYVTTWLTVNYSDPVGARPLLSTTPENFLWDERRDKTWRSWLVVFQYPNPPQLDGDEGQITTAFGGSFIDVGETVNGVWVPTTSGTPINAPFLHVTNLAGLSDLDVGALITISGSGHAENNGTFQIVSVTSESSCVIVNKEGVPSDSGPLAWEISRFPWIPPGLAWGSPGVVWGDGEGMIPPVDTGATVGGVWQPTTRGGVGELPTYAWGLRINALEIVTIRDLTRTWKDAATYVPNIIVAYDGLDGAYSRVSSEGAGNPDGTFGEVGTTVDGVWVPTRLINSQFDCYCQGTGRAAACSLENIT